MRQWAVVRLKSSLTFAAFPATPCRIEMATSEFSREVIPVRAWPIHQKQGAESGKSAITDSILPA